MDAYTVRLMCLREAVSGGVKGAVKRARKYVNFVLEAENAELRETVIRLNDGKPLAGPGWTTKGRPAT